SRHRSGSRRAAAPLRVSPPERVGSRAGRLAHPARREQPVGRLSCPRGRALRPAARGRRPVPDLLRPGARRVSEPRTALVTGGTRGIGLGIASALARAGWSLALCGVRPEAEVAGVTASLREAGSPDVLYCPADVGQRDDRRRLLDAVADRFGGLDALVNNAGRAPRVRADLLEATEESFEEVLRTNLQGPYFLT